MIKGDYKTAHFESIFYFITSRELLISKRRCGARAYKKHQIDKRELDEAELLQAFTLSLPSVNPSAKYGDART